MSDPSKTLVNDSPNEELTYEQAMKQLEKIIETLETNDLPLDESIKLFEQGQKLANYCSELLDKTELKVQQILGNKLEDFETSDDFEG
jgi:exodeoxyribonuclease VII small subunit